MGIFFGYLMRLFLRRQPVNEGGSLDHASTSYRIRAWRGWTWVLITLIVTAFVTWVAISTLQ